MIILVSVAVRDNNLVPGIIYVARAVFTFGSV